ncbi:V-type ATP synthase subunit I [Modicisalibacter tunisiensis]|uniref:V-type ATP synthase subunit I n=1 Tax=Modicisalibacter tunisiensis TaxID=390637 RepID=UPI00079709F5|nr:V-type ATP synthase subunit I [Modicisalibacter tunisiensis]KXS37531.1 MAG: V-type H+-transporting ATPase subunit I [Halomonadaceae bacterium T82-2]MBZ9539540.1 V-type ATP synthase subunit I [Modicisalibacter tunisiensis]
MSIAPMQRVTLIGLAERKREILRRLQALGVAHVIMRGEAVEEDRREHLELRAALDYLLDSPLRRRLQRPAETPELAKLLETIHTNRRRREDVVDRLTLLRRHRRALAPWGEFRFPPLEELGGRRLWLYLVPLGRREAIDAIALPWAIVNRDHRNLYLVVIAADEPTPEQVPFARSHTGGRSLTDIRALEQAAHGELEELDAERYVLTRWIASLADQLARAADDAELGRVMREGDDDGRLFVLDAWVPRRAMTTLKTLCRDGDVALRERAPRPDEEPPVLLDNPEWLAGGEEAVKFFQLPGYRSADPSAMVYVSFVLFFAIILADAGYALAFGALVWLARRRWKRSVIGRRLGSMGLAMSGGALLYGILLGSYFGLAPPPGSPLAALQWLSIDDFGAMMTLSIAIGVLHLIAANALAAWYAKPRRLALGNLGWILLLGGGFALWRVTQGALATPRLPWLALMAGGALLVLLFSRATPFDGWRHAAQRLGGGLISLGGLSQAFGNALSYMRLFALGLSSASLAVTFNQLAVDAGHAAAGAGPLLFLVVLLLGHALNFALALMGGVVHGLRLNLIEFLRWGIKGEGRPYQAFANKEESTWIK